MALEQTVLELTELIYAAAVDASQWPRFLEAFSMALGGSATCLTVAHPTPGHPPVPVTHGLEDAAVRDHAEHYLAVDPFQEPIQREAEGVLDFGERYITRSELERTEIFNDWYRPNGLVADTLGGVVMRRDGIPSILGVYRPRTARALEREHQELGRLLMPHLKRAFQIHCRLADANATAAALLGTLDQLAFGVILVDGGGRVVAVNRRAREIASRKDGLLLGRSEVRASRPSDTRAIRRLVADVVGHGAGREPGPGGTVSVRRPSPRRPLALLVSPLRIADADPCFRTVAGAIFVDDPDDPGSVSEELLRDLYGLTPREAEVAAQLGGGRTLPEVGEVLGISVNTVKVRLQEVFAKTETHRQADLSRLLARVSWIRRGS
jgi:DNA-binding CsgD family transcriptional regulator/PAS domain-containing protein